MRKFSVIVPSRNHSNVAACITAIRQCGEPCRIIVVDDGVNSYSPEANYVSGKKPFIYARNVNIGIKSAGDDDVIICGDDTRLLKTAGFSILAMSNYGRVDGSPFGIMSAAITGAVGNPNQLYTQTGRIRPEYKILCFVAVHIPRSVINTVGLLDERYEGYGCDDGDYCYRARKAGVPMYVNDDVPVEHGVLPSEFRGHGSMDFSANARVFEEIHGVPYLQVCGL